jgi:3-oxoacyl-[acyl-carrier protein] reductase
VGRVVTSSDPTSSDRVAIVTGGSVGLGRDIALDLAARGYAVVVHYAENQDTADGAVEEVLAADGSAVTVRGDVADELDVQRLFREASEAFGGVDVVVHTAGREVLGPLVDYDVETFAALLRTNVLGTFIVNRQAAREARAGGAIVNVPAADGPSTAAVETLTRDLARQIRERDITVNAVATATARPGPSAAIVRVVAFLVSSDGHRVNGEVIGPDDGMA